MPLLKRAMFSPAPIPARFRVDYSDAMALRPPQIRATLVDGALMIPGALSLRGHYNELSMPVVIMAGGGAKVVFARRAKQLQACIPGSVLQIVKSAAHMIHHSAPQQVVEAIRQVVEASFDVSDAQTSLLRAAAKRWVATA